MNAPGHGRGQPAQEIGGGAPSDPLVQFGESELAGPIDRGLRVVKLDTSGKPAFTGGDQPVVKIWTS